MPKKKDPKDRRVPLYVRILPDIANRLRAEAEHLEKSQSAIVELMLHDNLPKRRK